MGKTIKERAEHYVSVHVCADKRTYIDGATEQKAMDIDEICEWLLFYCMNELGLDKLDALYMIDALQNYMED